MESWCASSSILSCKGVRFSSTCEPPSGDILANHMECTYILNHSENDSELSLRARCNDDASPSTWSRISLTVSHKARKYPFTVLDESSHMSD